MADTKPPDNNLIIKTAPQAAQVSEVKPLDGKTTVDDKVAIESLTLAYASIESIACEISRVVNARNPSRVVIHNGSGVGSLLQYESFLAQTEVIRQAFLNAVPPADLPSKEAVALAAVIPAVTGTVKAVIDLISLFRTDVDIKGKDFIIDDTALVASVAHKLQSKGKIAVFYPLIQPLNFSSAGSKTLEKLTELSEEERKAEQAVATALASGPGDSGADAARNLEVKQRFEAAQALFQAFRDWLVKADPMTGVVPLTAIIQSEFLVSQLGEGGYVLYLKAVKAGGSSQTKRNLFTLFTGPRLSFSGGSIVTYLLFSRSGAIVDANTLYYHSGYKKFDTTTVGDAQMSNFTGYAHGGDDQQK